ncbi:MAG: hypothetical protein KC897_05890 [Candidatus Omnitrophica bacterium]|nr:hypothetical protein [Candidatus Omnitrophota bacterium]MCB9720430.1 hypothetical protein [Candidatus Omnitrophota bacterium]
MTILFFILCGIIGLTAGLLTGELCIHLAARRGRRQANPLIVPKPDPVPSAG